MASGLWMARVTTSLGICAIQVVMQPDLLGALSASDREGPPVTGVNATLMARPFAISGVDYPPPASRLRCMRIRRIAKPVTARISQTVITAGTRYWLLPPFAIWAARPVIPRRSRRPLRRRLAVPGDRPGRVTSERE
jgi:hypothetical protein